MNKMIAANIVLALGLLFEAKAFAAPPGSAAYHAAYVSDAPYINSNGYATYNTDSSFGRFVIADLGTWYIQAGASTGSNVAVYSNANKIRCYAFARDIFSGTSYFNSAITSTAGYNVLPAFVTVSVAGTYSVQSYCLLGATVGSAYNEILGSY